MPLFYIKENGGVYQVNRLPHERDNRPIIDRIPDEERQAIYDKIHEKIDSVVDTDKEVVTAGWIPGKSDWEGTVFQPIYYAAYKDVERAGMVLGTIVFECFMQREEDWSCGRYQIDGKDITSLTYFRIYKNSK